MAAPLRPGLTNAIDRQEAAKKKKRKQLQERLELQREVIQDRRDSGKA